VLWRSAGIRRGAGCPRNTKGRNVRERKVHGSRCRITWDTLVNTHTHARSFWPARLLAQPAALKIARHLWTTCWHLTAFYNTRRRLYCAFTPKYKHTEAHRLLFNLVFVNILNSMDHRAPWRHLSSLAVILVKRIDNHFEKNIRSKSKQPNMTKLTTFQYALASNKANHHIYSNNLQLPRAHTTQSEYCASARLPRLPLSGCCIGHVLPSSVTSAVQ